MNTDTMREKITDFEGQKNLFVLQTICCQTDLFRSFDTAAAAAAKQGQVQYADRNIL